MERQNNILFTDLQKFDLQKLQVSVTNFCKSVKFLNIKVLSAKNVKMSKMSTKKNIFTCVCAHMRVHTRVYTHTYMREKITDILTF